MSPTKTLDLPSSYPSLPFKEIKISHVPETSATPTPVILVTLNRPKNYNAFTRTMADELEQAFTLLDVDDRVKCIVMTGSGKMFCAGADLASDSIRSNDRLEGQTTIEHRDGGGRVAISIHRCRKPVLGALNGHAVGVGITMTLPMAIRLVSSRAKIAFPFARRGIVMEAASAFFLPRLIGYGAAMHLVTVGATLPASHRLLAGLFSEVVPETRDGEGAVLARALELAAEIARSTSTVSAALNRDLIWRGPASAEESHLLTSRLIADMFDADDQREGVASFLEKRDAKFTGSLQRDAPSAYPWWTEADTGNRPKAGRGAGEKPKL